MDGEQKESPKALEYLTKYLEIRDYSKALILANAILTNYPDNQLVAEIRKYVILQLNAPDDYEPITEQELEEVEHFDPNEELLSDSDEEEEEEDDDSEEEEESVQKISPPPPKVQQPPQKPKVGKLPPPRQRKPVKKIVKPNVRIAIHNVHNPPSQKKK